MRMLNRMAASKIKFLGVQEPNNEKKLAFTPILTTGGGFHSKIRHVNHPESCIIW